METYLCDNCGELVPTVLRSRSDSGRDSKQLPAANVEIGSRDPQLMKFIYVVDKDLCYQCVVPVFAGYFGKIAEELKEEYDEATIAMKVKNMASIPLE